MSTAVTTEAIVLTRTNFGEADRILTVLTRDQGKRRLMAKGVRKERSKLAGGIELFSVSHISYIPGRKEIDTLISTRLQTHYGNIVTDVTRTMLGYELLKRLNRATEDAAGEEYFDLLTHCFAGLDDLTLIPSLTELWFNAQLIKLAGHQPNLTTAVDKQKLSAATKYHFDNEYMAFRSVEKGKYSPNHIKLLRLVFQTNDPRKLGRLEAIDRLVPADAQLVQAILSEYVRL